MNSRLTTASPITRGGVWRQFSVEKRDSWASWIIDLDYTKNFQRLQVVLEDRPLPLVPHQTERRWAIHFHGLKPTEYLPLTYSLEEAQAYAIASFRMGK